ncbi:MAG: anthranilate synthase component, partial [Verrucomicrobiota bacterium]
MILIIDNYDSFTYNLVQYFGELGCDVLVKRNDEITVAEIESLNPDRICISPGPGRPEDAGISNEIIREIGSRKPILGVCLGHQCIGAVFGAEVASAPRFMLGKTSPVQHHGTGVFANLPTPFDATRYHSLIVRRETIPDCLEITAET